MERLTWCNLSLIRWIATNHRRGGAPLARAVLGLLLAQAGVLTLAGIALGVVLLYAALLLLQPYVDATYRLHLPIEPPSRRNWGRSPPSVSAAVLLGCCGRCAPTGGRWWTG